MLSTGSRLQPRLWENLGAEPSLGKDAPHLGSQEGRGLALSVHLSRNLLRASRPGGSLRSGMGYAGGIHNYLVRRPPSDDTLLQGFTLLTEYFMGISGISFAIQRELSPQMYPNFIQTFYNLLEYLIYERTACKITFPPLSQAFHGLIIELFSSPKTPPLLISYP